MPHVTGPGLDRRTFVAGMLAAPLPGCGERGRLGVAAPSGAGAGTQTILVATGRAADPAPLAYGPDRAPRLDYARLDVSVPPVHEAGRIEWPQGPVPDPSRDFALVGARMLPNADALVRAARGSGGDVVVFVHGYNNTFAEGVYRHAQIAWDYDLDGPQVHFAWPSAGHPLGYAYDRDSALIARDGLADVLTRLTKDSGRRVALIGHSMGAFLVMEALRQIALADGRDTIDRLAGVTLISPDIDVGLFRAQAARLAPLPDPFVVAVVNGDPMLRLSSRLTFGQARLGSLGDLSELRGLGVVVLDMTGLGADGASHFIPGTSPAAIALIRGLRDAGPPPEQGVVLGPVRIALAGGR